TIALPPLSLHAALPISATTAARKRGFIAGSGVPSLAATVISRASLPNSLDFIASCRPLRCMMFLNWEWPAMRGLLEGSEVSGKRSEEHTSELQSLRHLV